VPFTRETEGESGDTLQEGAWLCIVMRISEGTTLLLCTSKICRQGKYSFLGFFKLYSAIFNDVFQVLNLFFYMSQKFILLSNGIRLQSITHSVLAWLAIGDFHRIMSSTNAL
jgi:hypothetical protein